MISLAGLFGALIGVYVKLQTRISILENDQGDHSKLIEENSHNDKDRSGQFDNQMETFKDAVGVELEKLRKELKRIEDKSDKGDDEVKLLIKDEVEKLYTLFRRSEDTSNNNDKELRKAIKDDFDSLMSYLREHEKECRACHTDIGKDIRELAVKIAENGR